MLEKESVESELLLCNNFSLISSKKTCSFCLVIHEWVMFDSRRCHNIRKSQNFVHFLVDRGLGEHVQVLSAVYLFLGHTAEFSIVQVNCNTIVHIGPLGNHVHFWAVLSVSEEEVRSLVEIFKLIVLVNGSLVISFPTLQLGQSSSSGNLLRSSQIF